MPLTLEAESRLYATHQVRVAGLEERLRRVRLLVGLGAPSASSRIVLNAPILATGVGVTVPGVSVQFALFFSPKPVAQPAHSHVEDQINAYAYQRQYNARPTCYERTN